MHRHLTCTMQVRGNPWPQWLPPAPTLEALQISCRPRLLFPAMMRNRGSMPAHPMNRIFPGQGLLPESLALAQKSQMFWKVQMKKQILPPQLKPSPGSSAPQCRNPSRAHLRIAGNFQAQLRHLDGLHPSLHPERSSPGLLFICPLNVSVLWVLKELRIKLI